MVAMAILSQGYFSHEASQGDVVQSWDRSPALRPSPLPSGPPASGPTWLHCPHVTEPGPWEPEAGRRGWKPIIASELLSLTLGWGSGAGRRPLSSREGAAGPAFQRQVYRAHLSRHSAPGDLL